MAALKKHKLENAGEPPFKRFKASTKFRVEATTSKNERDEEANFLASDSDDDSDLEAENDSNTSFENANDLMPESVRNDNEIDDLINLQQEANETQLHSMVDTKNDMLDITDNLDDLEDFFVENTNDMKIDTDMIDEFDILSASDENENENEAKYSNDNSNSNNNNNNNISNQLLEIEESAITQDRMQEMIESDEKQNLREMREEARETLETDFVFPSAKKLLKEKNETPDLKQLKQRIEVWW